LDAQHDGIVAGTDVVRLRSGITDCFLSKKTLVRSELMKRSLFLALVTGFLVWGVGVREAKALTLADLLVPGATLTVDGLTFSNFSYTTTGSGMPTATNVTVTSVTDASGDGFKLTANPAFTVSPNAPTNGVTASSATIGYTVTATPVNNFIDTFTLKGNPSVTGGSGQVSVTETVNSSTAQIGATVIPPINTSQTLQTTALPGPVILLASRIRSRLSVSA